MKTEIGGIYTLDLRFQGIPGTIASYLIPHKNGAVLVECGPGSTLTTLSSNLESHGFTIKDISDVLLTHIHLDHTGAAGYLANQGARIHVHHVGAPHLLNPTKLLSSARRIYGDEMEKLWGEFLSVPEDRLSVLHDGDEIIIGNLIFSAIETLGHANHHLVYLLGSTCFSGDIAGVRLTNLQHLRLPLPPPELHLERWRESIVQLTKRNINQIAPTHFGIFKDPDWYLPAILKAIDETSSWIKAVMKTNPTIDQLRKLVTDETLRYLLSRGFDIDWIDVYETVNPSYMSADGLSRYWHKYMKT